MVPELQRRKPVPAALLRELVPLEKFGDAVGDAIQFLERAGNVRLNAGGTGTELINLPVRK
ncbi:MAG: hypothetical protein AMXMBFR47_39070 [Planctomycetota bacterium]